MEKWYVKKLTEVLEKTKMKIEAYNHQIDSMEKQLSKLYDEIEVLDYFIKHHSEDITTMQNHTLEKLRYDKSQEKDKILIEKHLITKKLDKVIDIRNKTVQELNGDDSNNDH